MKKTISLSMMSSSDDYDMSKSPVSLVEAASECSVGERMLCLTLLDNSNEARIDMGKLDVH